MIFLQKYILENCTLSIKALLCKLVRALVFCSDWLTFFSCARGSSLKHLRTSDTCMSSATSALSNVALILQGHRVKEESERKEKGDPGGDAVSPNYLTLFYSS